MCVKRIYLFVLLIYIILNGVEAVNNTTTKVPVPPENTKHLGALASFVKMLIDVPMGLVEAFKDGADAIETTVVAIMKAIF